MLTVAPTYVSFFRNDYGSSLRTTLYKKFFQKKEQNWILHMHDYYGEIITFSLALNRMRVEEEMKLPTQ